MSQRFDGEFATFVRKQLDELCTDFINGVAYEMANRIQKEHPDLAHSNIIDAISKVVRPSDGAEDKACEWFELSERDISDAFAEEFSDEDDWTYDDEDDWDEDDNSDESVAHADAVEREGMFNAEEAKFDAYTRHTYDANYTRPMLLSELAEIKRKAERKSRYFWRTIRWHDNGLEERVQFCQYDDYIENSVEDQATHYYGESPDVAVVGYGNDEWVIVAE
jgi:hypothetical protein